MTIVSSGLLETYTPSVSTQADQNIINQKVADNIESLRRFGIGIGDITSLHSHTAITTDNFTLYKKAGFISFYQFNSSTGNIDGVFDSATLQEGDQFLLVNKASTPSTNTVTLALGSYSLLGSSDTSIVLNSNSIYVYLVYIGSNKFIRCKHGSFTLNDISSPTSSFNMNSQSFINLDSISFNSSIGYIGTDTSDTADNKVIIIKPNAGSHGTSRGAYVYVAGNEFTGEEGNLGLVSGTAGSILFVPQGNLSAKFNTSGHFELSTNTKFSTNNLYTIGDGTKAPSDIYTVNAVTVTSDKNKKRDITDINKDFAVNLVKKIAQTAVKKYKWIDSTIDEVTEEIEVPDTENIEVSNYEIVEQDNKLIKKLITKTITVNKTIKTPVYDENDNIIEYQDKIVYKKEKKIIPKQELKHNRYHDGFIAQEIEDILKDLNIDKKDYPAFILIDKDNNYSLRVTELLPYLFLAINDLYQRIDNV